jgi:hypothetical protein
MIDEGWLGDPDEWPSLFFRNHVIPPERDILGLLDLGLLGLRDESDWLEHTSHSTVLVYMEVEDDGEGEDLRFNLLSAIPDVGRRENHATWLEYEMNTDEGALWEAAFGTECRYCKDNESMTPVADWAMRNGICPGQWFVVKLEPDYQEFRDYESGHYEYEFECGATVLDCEKLSPQEHAKRWLEFLTGQVLEDGRPRLAEKLIGDTVAVSLSWVCAK